MARIALKELETERSLAVEQLEALIGRDPACGFVIDGPKSKVVSGRHARIFFQDSTWWIQDMSRNGTILDDERLQSGQRHALKTGQLIGLGESGPRLRVMTLESRAISQTIVEPGAFGGASPHTTAPRARQMRGGSVNAGDAAAASPPADARAGVKFEEPTEPARLSGMWHLIVKLRAAHSDQRFDARASVVRMGRSPECSIRIPPEQGASVSRVHAEISVGDAGVVVRDAGSRNGTFLNGTRIEASQPLVIGDRLMLGTGGPTLEVEELHIVKGEGPAQSSSPRLGGSATPEAFATASPPGSSREPPTAPFLAGSEGGHARSRDGNGNAAVSTSPARGIAAATSASNGVSTRTIVYVVIAVLALALAVIIGRMTAS